MIERASLIGWWFVAQIIHSLLSPSTRPGRSAGVGRRRRDLRATLRQRWFWPNRAAAAAATVMVCQGVKSYGCRGRAGAFGGGGHGGSRSRPALRRARITGCLNTPSWRDAGSCHASRSRGCRGTSADMPADFASVSAAATELSRRLQYRTPRAPVRGVRVRTVACWQG